MRRIINKKIYDDSKATFIGSYSNDLGSRDFRDISESLYKTSKGEFFLSGEGGPMTHYAEKCGNMTSGSRKIIPLTKDEALDWCENHNISASIICAEFGDELEEA